MAQAVDALVERGEQLKRDGIVIRTYDLWKTYIMGIRRFTPYRAGMLRSGAADTWPSWAPPGPENQHS